MQVSIIISTWNNADRLAITLGHLTRCRVPPGLCWELVLVNNACTDHTDSVAARFKDVLPLAYVREPVQGLSRAKNRGIAAAHGELIIFTDDDVLPGEDWIETYWAAWQEFGPRYYYGGPVWSEFESKAPSAALLAHAPGSVKGLDWGAAPRALSHDDPMFVSANWACAASALREAGGFDENLGLNARPGRVGVGEESDLMRRLESAGLIPWYLPNARIGHFVPRSKTTVRHVARRMEATGYQWGRYGSDHDLPSVPDWMYKVLAKQLLAVLRHVGRPEYISHYLEFREMLGRIRGLRDRLKAQGA